MLLKGLSLVGGPKDVNVANKEFPSPVNLSMFFAEPSPESQLVNKLLDTDDCPDFCPVLRTAMSLNPNGFPFVPRYVTGPFTAF